MTGIHGNIRKRLGQVLAVCFLGLGVLVADGTSASTAVGKVIEEDANGDGRIDRIAYLDASGNLVRLEVDENRDGKMDTFQYYQNGRLTRLEKMDTRGRTAQVTEFDDRERPVRQETDLNHDGRLDQVVRYDPQGRPASSAHDLDGDGRKECSMTYREGRPVRQECDHFNRGRPDTLTEYSNGQPVLERKDADGDGVFEVTVRLQGGVPLAAEEDVNRDGRSDRFTEYDSAGRPRVIKESTGCNGRIDQISRFRGYSLVRLEEFGKGGAGPKTVTEFENNRAVSQTVDEDGDGRPEQTTAFDGQGNMSGSKADTNRDGREDTWIFFENGNPVRMEQDLNHDGQVDCRTEYVQGKQARILLDSDHDGRFETVQTYDDPDWTMVMETDENGDGRPEARYAYQDDILRRKETFEADGGRPIGIEEYDESGRLVLSRVSEGCPDRLNMVWTYDRNQTAVLAEADTDCDGRPDTWFHYRDGQVIKVEEDRNRDGVPDLWETYGPSGQVISRSEDLDFDGVPDIEKQL